MNEGSIVFISRFNPRQLCEENARHVHPGSGLGKGKWDVRVLPRNDWIHEKDIDKLVVKCIGVAQPGLFQEDEIIMLDEKKMEQNKGWV